MPMAVASGLADKIEVMSESQPTAIGRGGVPRRSSVRTSGGVSGGGGTSEGGGPLSPDDYAVWREAQQRRKAIDRAGKVASYNGWQSAIMGAISLALVALSFDLSALLISLVMVAVACLEFRGRAMLRRGDPAAGRLLGFNQLGFMIALILYCLWCIYTQMRTSPAQVSQLLPQQANQLMPQLGAQIAPLLRELTMLVYSVIIVVVCCFQGGMSLYYFTRIKHLRAYREQTPQWVIELGRES